ncbi:hypothetical protein NESM_000510300 [Novymonas esmeraldas]|uniref:Uncharacterized protein n=1 Tax=Novymonas esmeraldas TaxID=1808958 RepID=A0AAW0ENL7_9TRYP
MVESMPECESCDARCCSPTSATTAAYTPQSTSETSVQLVGEDMSWSLAPTVSTPASAAAAAAALPEHARRVPPRSLSVYNLDAAVARWDAGHDGAALSTHGDAAACGEADDGCIPYDYESEMEECSGYTFSDGPYSPSTTAALAAAASSPPLMAKPASSARPDTPRVPSVLALPRSNAVTSEHVHLSPQWCERQRRDIETYRAGKHYVWHQEMKQAAAVAPDQMRYAFRSLAREARCREIRALRSQPAVAFVRMDAPLWESRTRSSMRASCLLASATSTAQRKARYIQLITEHWEALEERLEEMLSETEKKSHATSESHLRSVGYALNALSLFSSDPQMIIREMNMGHVEEQRRQRHDREAHLLTTLESQGRLFLLPRLYAEEEEEPVPVIRIEPPSAACEAEGQYAHPWQVLSPDTSLHSTTPSPTPDDSIGAVSPCSSGCMSASCSPMLSSQHSSVASAPLTFSRCSVWKDMQPPRLPLLELFMTAPAVVPSTVVADSEVGVPYVMPVDPTYAQQEVARQEALTRAAPSDPLLSPQFSGALVRGGRVDHCVSGTHQRLLPMLLDGAEDSWGSYTEESAYDDADAMGLDEAEMLLLRFALNEAVTLGGSGAPTRATLTDG